MSVFHYIFLYLVIGVMPSIPFIAAFLFFTKKDLREIPKLPLFILFVAMGWVLNNFFDFF